MSTLIAIPAMDMVHTQFMTSLIGLRHGANDPIATTQATVIHTARDVLARQAIEHGCERIMWLDSDMQFRSDIMERLAADLDEGYEMVSALYFGRRTPYVPIIFEKIEYDEESGDDEGITHVYHRYPENGIFEIAGCGFGACMMTTKLLARVMQKFKRPFHPVHGLGEDLAFCWRAAQVGAHIYCDSRIKANHIGMHSYNEDDYFNAKQTE